MEDPDIECTAVLPGGAEGDFSFFTRADDRTRGLPETPSELFAYDALILSNVPREALGEQTLAWVDEWIGRRGGGLCMVGGPNSFASGQWGGTPVGTMLPVSLLPDGRDWNEAPTRMVPDLARASHPIWHLSADDAQNRAILKTLPGFLGSNRVGSPKSGAEVLALAGTQPALAVQPYGRGRTVVMTTPITRRWAGDFIQSWGEKDARYYKKFWRNTVYWLTENSSIGRRRLLAETDKRLYRPGEPIVLRARTFDENAALTLDYRVAVTVEPRSASDVTTDDSPLRRPSPGAESPFLPWGEEFELTRVPAEKSYSAAIPVAEARSLPPASP
ncbi:MAG: glutamine amidotransferase [Singulisphaera sp.]